MPNLPRPLRTRTYAAHKNGAPFDVAPFDRLRANGASCTYDDLRVGLTE